MLFTPLPIGIDDFEEIITKKYYYVDKTLFIKDILDKKGKVNLFTRPRRFGKTLNLSMLQNFFEKQEKAGKKHLFDGLKIMDAGEQYTSEQEQYPVIFLTLKSAKQPDYEMAYASLVDDLAREYARHGYVLDSTDILEEDKERFRAIRGRKANPIDYAKSLAFLSQCLYEYHQKKVIILIDEYDVPLENAYYNDFYDRMAAFIRSLFESALKTNPYLEFSVITGCLRISKESIFTGLNNLKIISILNNDYDEYFGFVESEVQEMLAYYKRDSSMDTMKQWYDGYLFGDAKVYNPWSVINYTEKLCSDENAFPTVAWSNTSSNSIIKDLIYRADDMAKGEIEALVNGAAIEKTVHEDITYDDIYESEDNLWNFLFFTGYLKQISMRMEGVNRYVTMTIPNNELLYIYENTIQGWFRDKVKAKDFSLMYEAMATGKADIFERELAEQLFDTISYMDGKEAFYHGFLLGLLMNVKGYRMDSNKESGESRYDICIYNPRPTIPPIIFELKVVSEDQYLEQGCDEALKQIADRKYAAPFKKQSYEEVLCYGIAFCGKHLKVKLHREKFV